MFVNIKLTLDLKSCSNFAQNILKTHQMKIFKNALLFGFFFLTTLTVFSQSKVTGTVLDGELNQPLAGASVVIKGTTNGVATDFDGKFELTTTQKSGEIVISFLGFDSKTISFTVTGATTNVGSVVIAPNVSQLDDLVIVGKGIIDLAADRKTPIAVSTIKAAEIQQKSGNWDLPELLKSTPSVQNVKGGGFGDGQMFLRGFDQTNTAFLLNGQPINGMEDGKMYWSNWSGVLDIANSVQVQRGLGSSKLAISSVGGTINVVTKTLDKKQGGFVQQMLANDNYTKTTAYYSTGLMENGFAFSGMLGHWQGNGYIDGTHGQGQTYFLSFGYKAGEKDILNFLVTGAPQWHGANNHMNLSTLLDKGRDYSDNYGTLNGQYYAGGRNYYHKPVLNLNWDHTFNDKVSLSTVLYGSFGRGGFEFLSGVGRNAEGLYDFDTAVANGVGYSKASVNAHNWFGLVSNLDYKLNDNLSFNVGFDGRMYNGQHYRNVVNFFGASSVNVNNNDQVGAYSVTESYGYNPWDALFGSTPRNQRLDRDYEEQINYIGTFGQLEYAKNNFSAYFQGAISTQSHQREGFFFAEEVGKSEKVNNLGYNIKAGGSYKIGENHNVFANAGFYSRQPYHDDLFTNARASNELNPYYDQNQEITGLEAGYQFKSQYVSANLNVYHTIWDNRVLFDANDTTGDGVSDVFTQSTPAKQVHQGVELELFINPLDKLKMQGFVSIGDWKYDGNVSSSDYDDQGNLLSSGDTKYIDGVEIGNVAQFTAGFGANYEVLSRLNVDANWNYYNKMFGNTDLASSEWNDSANRGAIELPSYNTVDAGVSYKWLLGKEKQNNLQFRVNINNVFDELYIENSRDNKHVDSGDDVWNGVDTTNRVKLGYGRTWNFSIRFNF